MSEKPLLKVLWILFAVTCPLFAVQLARYKSDLPSFQDLSTHPLTLPIPFAILIVLMITAGGAWLVRLVRERSKISDLWPTSRSENLLWLTLLLFLAWHVVGWMNSDHPAASNKILLKLSADLLALWTFIYYFPRDFRFMELFWKLILGTSALLVGFLVYRYVFVFEYNFLGSSWFEPTPTDKGHLTWYLMPIVLFSLFYFLECRRKILFYPFLFIFITGWLYACSRGAWLGVLLGLASVIPLVGWRRYGTYMAFLLLTVALSWLFLETFVNAVDLQFPRRLLWFIRPESTGFQTYAIRSSFLQRGLTSFKTAPFTGVGLGDTDCINHLQHIPLHNDYMTILADLGLIGLILFLVLHFVIGFKVLWRNYSDQTTRSSWLSLGYHATLVAIVSSFMHVNVYLTPFLWVLVGLSWVEADIRRNVS